jgi:cellulose biosynthesis protein BcsQ
VTQTAQVATTQVIVVGEDEIYNTLAASGVGWDLQHQVRTLAQLRDDLSAGRLSSHSGALVISDSVPAQADELEALVAWAAPYLHVFVVAWDPAGANALYERIMTHIQTTQGEGEPEIAGIYFVPADTGAAMLEGMREVLEELLPWPAEYAGGLYESLTRSVAVVPTFHPGVVAARPMVAVPAAVPVQAAPAPAPTYTQPTFGQKVIAQNVTGTPLAGQVTLAVTSSKGGSGKSTTAMLVASTIAHGSRKAFEAGLIPRPLKVALVDMDTRDGQVASMIGQYMPTAINIRVEPRWDQATILRNLVYADRLEIDCLLAPVRPRSADDVGPEFYRHVIRTLQCTHDVVVMDTSVNYLDPLISTVCLPEATGIMFVTTLVATAVQGMARALNEITGDVESDGMGIPAEKIGVVVNQAMSNVGMDKGQVLEAALGVPIIGQVPMASQDVQLATNHNRMCMLMEHPQLGPAYFALAQACLPNTQLLPPADWDSTGGSPSGNTGQAPAGSPPAAVKAVQAVEQPQPAPAPRRRGFLRRR